MSWAEVQKINDNMSIPLNELLTQFLAGGFREYIYENKAYEVPFTGLYTIRAYTGYYGSYGKLVGKLEKGEKITIALSSNSSISITSDKKNTSEFGISLGLNSVVNGNSSNFKSGIAIGGARANSRGGDANIRCNNGIASGGGGASGYYNGYETAKKGGDARAWGNNCYALGGGGGGGSSGKYPNSTIPSAGGTGGAGGKAFVNDIEITDYCSNSRTQTLKSGRGHNGETIAWGNASQYYNHGTSGGDGGCGGGAYAPYSNESYYSYGNGGAGYFSGGESCHQYYDSGSGGSARGGNGAFRRKNYTKFSSFEPKDGYFAGGDGAQIDTITPSLINNASNHFQKGGVGGFYGGNGGKAFSSDDDAIFRAGDGGVGTYGIGGKGGLARAYYSNQSSMKAGNGGAGKIKGGDGGDITASYGNQNYLTAGNGGNGFFGGAGGKTSYGNNGADGINIFTNRLIGTAPRFDKNKYDSIVIIEYGDSPEDF